MGVKPVLKDSGFARILEAIGRPWKGYRKVRHGPMKRIRRQMLRLGTEKVDQYIAAVMADPAEMEMLQESLRITISRFNRDRFLWDTLRRELLPRLWNHHRRIRAWSAGCCCGEEVYSLKMAWHECGLPSSALEIVATDASAVCLERARKGRYGRSSLRELSPGTRTKYFVHTEEDVYAFDDELKNGISWVCVKLEDNIPDGLFHLVFLRNSLLTYYTDPCRSRILTDVLGALHPEGFLIVGSHENIPPHFPLEPLSSCAMCYQHTARQTSKISRLSLRKLG